MENNISFNSLQTGKYVARETDQHQQPIHHNQVSIPFKRESM